MSGNEGFCWVLFCASFLYILVFWYLWFNGIAGIINCSRANPKAGHHN